MQSALMKVVGVFLAAAAWQGSVVSAHPIDDVIAMMKGLSEKATAQGKEEELTYVKFEHWCKNSKKTLDDSIAKGNADAAQLTDDISAKTKQSGVLDEEIKGLEQELGKLDVAETSAQGLRDSTASLYGESEQDFSSTIEAIASAITALGGAQKSTTELAVARQSVRKVAMLALSAVSSTKEQREALQQFVGSEDPAERPELKAEGDDGAHVKKYAFKSGSVIELLKSLKAKFEDDQLAATKAETNSINAHSLSKDARQNAIKAADDSKTSKTAELATVQSDLAAAEGELEQVQQDLTADTSLLSATDKQCAVKESEWAERSKTRALEIESLETAIKILAKVTGVRTEAPSNPVPPPSPLDAASSFLQVDDPKQRAVNLLREEARVAHSRALYRLAQEISVHESGPMDEVNNMIQKMIQHLMSEQTDEDTHKNWCDAELKKTDVSKSDKNDKHAELTAKINTATASAQVLATEVSDNTKMLEDIASHVAEATEIRQTGKDENKASMKDSVDAQSALTNAISVLETHYKDSGMMKKEDWEFVQRGVDLPDSPSTWDAGYSGVADPTNQPGGIVSMLKKVSADFARMEAETRAQEETDQSEFEEDMKRSEIERARRTKESDMKEKERQRLTDKVGSLSKTRKQTASELEAVNQYLKDLMPACINGDSTYEDRKGARDKEIEALHQAQDILGNWDSDAPKANGGAAFLAPTQRRAVVA